VNNFLLVVFFGLADRSCLRHRFRVDSLGASAGSRDRSLPRSGCASRIEQETRSRAALGRERSRVEVTLYRDGPLIAQAATSSRIERAAAKKWIAAHRLVTAITESE
jgi:hypothetical protein